MRKKLSQSTDGILISTPKKVITILTIGVVIGASAALLLNNFYIDLFTHRASEYAQAVSPEDVKQLKNLRLADDAVPYEKVRKKLADLKSVYGQTRFVYIMSRDSGGVRFLADSEPTSSASYSPRGEPYPDATPALIALFDNKRPFTEGPVRDDYGTWYSSLAAITDDKGTVIGVIGFDIEAQRYFTTVIGFGLLPVLFALVIALAIAAYDASRRQKLATFRFQNELVSIASHELRTPLTGLRWGEEVLMSGTLDESQKKMLGIMYDSTLRLQESLEDVLQLASIDMKRAGDLNFVPVELSDIIKQTVTIQRLAAEQKNVFVSFDDAWPDTIVVNGESTKLRRVFNNIVSNAIKYARHNTLITITYTRKDDNHVIAVRNEGIGIPADELSHIFDGFFRASNALKSNASGTGMGLFLSRTIIEQHRGKLWLESTENVDTTAYISLPISTPVKTVAPADTAPSHV